MFRQLRRRDWLRGALVSATAIALPRTALPASRALEFEISLTERSFTRSIAEQAVDHLDVARIAKTELDISAIEYSSRFFRDKARDNKYLEAMNVRAADHGVRQLLIMVDNEGSIADPDANQRQQVIQNHQKWIDVAKALGCHSIEVNLTSSGRAADQQQRAVAGLSELCEYAAKLQINVLVGNYGGVSADPAWLLAVVKTIDRPCCGTLPRIGKLTTEQQYQDLLPIVPLAKGITAMTFAFDQRGGEANTDYSRAMKLVQQAGYHGYVGIHYAGDQLEEREGIRATKRLLESLRESAVQQRPGNP